MPYDTKLLVIAKRSGQPMAYVNAVWLCLLDAASQNSTRGFVEVDAESIAVSQDMEVDAVNAILKAFYAKGIIDREGQIVSWNKRQHTTSTERSKKFRKGKTTHATPSNTTQRDATDGNAAKRKNTKISPDTDIDYRTDLEVDLRADLEKSAEETPENKSHKKTKAREEKREREREKHKKFADETAQEMLQIWNAKIQSKLTKGHNAILTPERKTQMAERWVDTFNGDMRAWRYFCEIISASDFCMGKVAGKGWTIDISWATESIERAAKVLEGRFSGGNHPPKPPACEVPELQQAWDKVLHGFQLKHGKHTYRSWLSQAAITTLQPRQEGAAVVMRCPTPFVRDWIAQHYHADLLRGWQFATADDANKVTALELTVAQGAAA